MLPNLFISKSRAESTLHFDVVYNAHTIHLAAIFYALLFYLIAGRNSRSSKAHSTRVIRWYFYSFDLPNLAQLIRQSALRSSLLTCDSNAKVS